MKLETYRRKADCLINEYNHTRKQIRDEKELLKSAKQHQKDVSEAQIIIQTVSQKVQQIAHQKVASIVSECLRSIFEEPYTFKIAFERKRGKTEARLLFMKGEHEVDPTTAAGGGPLSIASFALRLACIILSKPSPRKLIVLDEPFLSLSSRNKSRIAGLIKRLSEELGIQFLIVTHDQELEIGKKFSIT